MHFGSFSVVVSAANIGDGELEWGTVGKGGA